MIRVTIDLVPMGNEAKKRTLHTIEIWNDLRETVESKGRRGGYRFRISRKYGPHNPNRKGEIRWQHDGEISGFPRMSKNAVHLLRSVLNEAYYGADETAVHAEEFEEPVRVEPSWARGDYDEALRGHETYPDEGATRAMQSNGFGAPTGSMPPGM